MAVTYRTSQQNYANSGTQYTFADLVGVQQHDTVIAVAYWPTGTSSMTTATCGGASMTVVTKVLAPSGGGAMGIAYLTDVASAGDKSVVLNWGAANGGLDAVAVAYNWNGETPQFDGYNNTTPPTISGYDKTLAVTAGANALIFVGVLYKNGVQTADFVAYTGGTYLTNGGTNPQWCQHLYQNQHNAGVHILGAGAAGSKSAGVTNQYSSGDDDTALIVLSFSPAAAAGGFAQRAARSNQMAL